MKIIIDFETRSRADLKAVGQYAYANHESTEIMCIGWKIVGKKEAHVIPYHTVYAGSEYDIAEFLDAIKKAEYVIAHNAGFEQAIWKYTLSLTTSIGRFLPLIPIEKWVCTLSFCSIFALPRSLEGAGEALSLGIKKDTEGKKLLLQMCKPKRVINDLQKWIEWAETDEQLKRLYEYCKTDLYSEEDLFTRLVKYTPFTKQERDLWCLNQKQNQRGFAIDLELVDKVLNLIAEEENHLNESLRLKTFGWVKTAKQVKAFRDWLLDQGVSLPNLQKKTVDDMLVFLEKENLEKNKDVIEVLKIRQSLGKSSTSKYQAFKNRADNYDKRVRDNLLFHGASTGRDSGQGVQPQNFPRGNFKMKEEFFGDIKTLDIEMLRVLYGPPMNLFSNALRGVIVPTGKKELFSGDFSSIEARVLLWIADDHAGLKEYYDGIDPYKSMASVVYGVPYIDVTDEHRQVGKQIILACGFQMGLKKFILTAYNNGLELEEDLAKKAHEAFRLKYPRVPQVWSNVEQAAIHAVETNKKVSINHVSFYVKGEFLFCEFPSKRKIVYYGPAVKQEATPWGDLRPKLYHWGVNSLTKKWEFGPTYGGRLVENIVQGISRDIMKEAELRIETFGYDVLLTVHDEIVSEHLKGNLKEFTDLMAEVPLWATGLPLKVGSWSGYRYRK